MSQEVQLEESEGVVQMRLLLLSLPYVLPDWVMVRKEMAERLTVGEEEAAAEVYFSLAQQLVHKWRAPLEEGAEVEVELEMDLSNLMFAMEVAVERLSVSDYGNLVSRVEVEVAGVLEEVIH